MDSNPAFINIIKEDEGHIFKVVKVYTYTNGYEQGLYQEMIYQLWKFFPFFRAEAKVSTWMYRIALNTAIACQNKEKRKSKHLPIDGLLV